MAEKRENLKSLGGGFYVVRTQAGFKKALKLHYPNGTLCVNEPDCFPTVYPALVILTTGYQGYTFPCVRWKPLNRLKNELNQI